MNIGDIVEYMGKEYYLYSITKGDLCTIVRIRDGDIYNYKGEEKRLNASIVNLPIKELN